MACSRGGDGVDVALLVEVGVALCVGRRGRELEAVVVGDVGGETPDGLGRAGGFVDLREEVGGGTDVGGPAEPAAVRAVDVHGYVVQVESLERVGDALCKMVSIHCSKV